MPEHLRNSETKAALIAAGLWRRGLWPRDLAHLPDTSRQRTVLTVASFARVAFRESDDPAGHDRNPPGGRDSETWRAVTRKLKAWERDGDGPERDLMHDRDRWLPPTTEETPCGHASGSSAPRTSATSTTPASPAPGDAGIPSGNTTSTAGASTSTPAPADGGDPPPKGWAQLAALPPLEHGACFHHPDRRPVVITKADGGRCADCPPRRREIRLTFFPTRDELASLFGKKGHEGVVVPYPSVRDGWGIGLDWTPKPHTPGRCYCGRC